VGFSYDERQLLVPYGFAPKALKCGSFRGQLKEIDIKRIKESINLLLKGGEN